MRRVLVTRPQESGQELCQMLNARGMKALHQPLIDIQPGHELSGLYDALCCSDIIIAVSQYAVSFAAHSLAQHAQSWPTPCRYFAVGQKTAQCLSKACGQTVHFPKISDSEHLVALPELTDISGKTVVILRGNGGRDVIYDTLQSRGASVRYKEVYQRTHVPVRVQESLTMWQNMGIDTLVITSQQQLTIFTELFNDIATNWHIQQTLLVPSERIAHYAHTLGFTKIIVSGSAHNTDLVAALSPNQQDSSNDK